MCLADESLNFDEQLHFIKEPVENMDREVKTLKHSKILMFESDTTLSLDQNTSRNVRTRC